MGSIHITFFFSYIAKSKNKMLSIVVRYMVLNMLWTIILVIVAIIIIVLLLKFLANIFLIAPVGFESFGVNSIDNNIVTLLQLR